MDYECCMDKNVVIVSLSADLDHHMAARLRDEIDEMLDKGVSKLLFDFDRINFMDSSGIGLIMGRYKKLQGRGPIAVSGAHYSVKRILEISGLHKIVKVFDNVDQAKKYLQEVK